MILSVHNTLHNVGGLGNVLMSFHDELPEYIINTTFKISTFDKFEALNSHYNIKKEDFLRFQLKNLRHFKECKIVLSHHRKLTTYLVLFKKIFHYKFKVIHIAHNEYHSLRSFTLFPEHIITVSEGVKKNHIEYFRIPANRITVIYNGIKDTYKESFKSKRESIKILVPARICVDKQQLEIVSMLNGKISRNIKIIFAGTGPLENELKLKVKDTTNFQFIGMVSNADELYSDIDYVMLYSKREGLPISLIEATMYKKPIICNNVGGNLEILEHNKNGFNVNSFDDLIECINSLDNNTSVNYLKMSKASRTIYEKKFRKVDMIKNYVDYINQINIL